MLEIYIIVSGSAKVAEMAENKGYSGLLFRLLFIGAWFFGALFSVVLAAVLTDGGGTGGICIFLVAYLMGGLLGIGAVTLLVAVLPEPTRERHYMDDYREYQDTGRVHKYGRDRYEDDEDEDERRARRRSREAPDERRPRRDGDDRPRREERYREDRDDRRRDDPDDRPRRRPRREEDY